MKKIWFLLCFVCFAASNVQAQIINLPEECQKILERQFRSWKFAEINSDIVEYFKQKRSFEQPNLINGDWNGDGKTDFAALLENKNNAEKRIMVVLMKGKNGYKSFVLDAYDCLMSVKKGSKDYDFEARKSFRYKTDAIFSYYWEKAGTSYVWENGKFRAIATSD